MGSSPIQSTLVRHWSRFYTGSHFGMYSDFLLFKLKANIFMNKIEIYALLVIVFAIGLILFFYNKPETAVHSFVKSIETYNFDSLKQITADKILSDITNSERIYKEECKENESELDLCNVKIITIVIFNTSYENQNEAIVLGNITIIYKSGKTVDSFSDFKLRLYDGKWKIYDIVDRNRIPTRAYGVIERVGN